MGNCDTICHNKKQDDENEVIKHQSKHFNQNNHNNMNEDHKIKETDISNDDTSKKQKIANKLEKIEKEHRNPIQKEIDLKIIEWENTENNRKYIKQVKLIIIKEKTPKNR